MCNLSMLFSSEPPSFVTLPEPQAALPNATVRFKGVFKGTPPFTVKWFHNDTELMTGPTCFTGLDGQACFLELYSVRVAQSGLYSCQVSNDAGSVRCSADLAVKGWDSFSYITSCVAVPSLPSTSSTCFPASLSLLLFWTRSTAAPSLSCCIHWLCC